MTRRQAIRESMKMVEKSRISADRKKEMLQALQLCLDELPFARWSKEAIFDACDDFIQSRNQNLTTGCFSLTGMPSHSTIKHRFGMTAKEFRDKYYPLVNRNPRSPYRSHPVEYWNERFIKDFNEIMASSQDDYNKRRDQDLPSWFTLARMNGLSTWTALLDLLGLKTFPRSDQPMRFVIKYVLHD